MTEILPRGLRKPHDNVKGSTKLSTKRAFWDFHPSTVSCWGKSWGKMQPVIIAFIAEHYFWWAGFVTLTRHKGCLREASTTVLYIHCTLQKEYPSVSGKTKERRDIERTCRENIDIWVKVVHCVQSRQPAQYILYCDQMQYRIYCAGWPVLYTMDHLHLSFKSFQASSGRQRTGPPVYL
jgi:hypothetical protein